MGGGGPGRAVAAGRVVDGRGGAVAVAVTSFRNFNPAQPHGGFSIREDFAALDSAPWSPSLVPLMNPRYSKNSFGGSLIGSPYIPGLTKPNTKQFVFLNLSGQRNLKPQFLQSARCRRTWSAPETFRSRFSG